MILPDLSQEESLWQTGVKTIVGIDEVGRGSWAGPLVAAGVILPTDFNIPSGLADSKLISHKKRVELDKIIRKSSISLAIAEISCEIIDKIGITKATQIAFRKIVKSLSPRPQYCLVDAFHIKYISPEIRQKAIKHGDRICASIASASIVAKVYRDRLMESLGRKYPSYNFQKNKGYGTKDHQKAIQTFGFTKIHRTSYNLDFLFA